MGYLSCHCCGVQLFDTKSTLCTSCATQAQTEELLKNMQKMNMSGGGRSSGESSNVPDTVAIILAILGSAAGAYICFQVGSFLMPYFWPLAILLHICGVLTAIGGLIFFSSFF